MYTITKTFHHLIRSLVAHYKQLYRSSCLFKDSFVSLCVCCLCLKVLRGRTMQDVSYLSSKGCHFAIVTTMAHVIPDLLIQKFDRDKALLNLFLSYVLLR